MNKEMLLNKKLKRSEKSDELDKSTNDDSIRKDSSRSTDAGNENGSTCIFTFLKKANFFNKKGNEKYIMDSEGRLLDERGNILPSKVFGNLNKPAILSTLKINQKKEQEGRLKELKKTHKLNYAQIKKMKESKFFDPTLEMLTKKKDNKRKMAFNFIQQGTFSNFRQNLEERKNKQIEIKNNDNNTDNSEKKVKSFVKNSTLPTTTKITLKAEVKLFLTKNVIPDCEWWDLPYLKSEKKSFSPYWFKDPSNGEYYHQIPETINKEDFKFNPNIFQIEKINHYIQHPVPIKNENIEKLNKIQLPTFLTKKERKRLRKIRRQTKEKEKQELIKLGLRKPDPPKLKFNNFMNILGEDAIQDPSRVEKEVKKAYEERIRKMLEDNEKRKLTKEQKAQKIRRKFDRDIKKECRACLFRIEDLTNPSIKFKIIKNCKQLYLTGICLKYCGDGASSRPVPNFLYVEGGPLAIKKLKNLLLRRIKWDKLLNKNNNQTAGNDNDENNEDEDEELIDGEYRKTTKCVLLWEGTIKKRLFEKWKMFDIFSENDAKNYLKEKGLDSFFTYALSYRLN